MNPLNAIRGSDRVRQRWRHALVVFEIATTVALLVSTGAMLSSYAKSLNDSPGFDTHPIFAARINDPKGIDPRPMLDRLRALPGVAAVEVATTVPFLAIGPPHRVAPDAHRPRRIPVAGRRHRPAVLLDLRRSACAPAGCSPTLTRMRSEPVAIVNDVLATQLWPGSAALTQPAIGKQVWIEGRSAPGRWRGRPATR